MLTIILLLSTNVFSDNSLDIHSPNLRNHYVKRWAQLAAGYRPVYPKTFGDTEYEYFHAKILSGLEDDAIKYAKEASLEYVGRLGELKNRFIYRKKLYQKRSFLFKRGNSTVSTDTHFQELSNFTRNYKGVSHFDRVVPKVPIFKRFLVSNPPVSKRSWKDVVKISDPMFDKQWHLLNSKIPGNDINVTGVWEEGINGQNITVALIDDGLDYTSEDLFLNFDFEGSYDFNDNTKLPTPRLSDDYHGTRCAGQIAARINNVCGVGAAFGSKVSGIRMLSDSVDEITQITAVNYKYQHNDIYSCSWGPNDDGSTLMGPTEALNEAFINGVENGRHGKGSIFVFATGNGGRSNDNCNFDGYTNSIYTISIGAIDNENRHPDYSESCSAQIAVTYSSSDTLKISTTDIGLKSCTNSHGGTSAAAPLAAGVIALVLSVRPDLSWRDVQALIVDTAIPVSTSDTDWDTVANGRKFNHKFGFGKLDAYKLVQAAKTFKNLGPQTNCSISSGRSLGLKIPAKGKTDSKPNRASSVLSVSSDMVNKADLKSLEHITVILNAKHTMRGSMHIFLESPSGIKSELAPPRMGDYSEEGFEDWKFMSMKHWGGPVLGDWKLTIENGLNDEHTGTLTNWTLTLFGESNAPGPKPMPPLQFSKVRSDNSLPNHIFESNEMDKERLQNPSSNSSDNKQRNSNFDIDDKSFRDKYAGLFIGFNKSETIILFFIIFCLVFAVCFMAIKVYKLKKHSYKWNQVSSFPDSRNPSLDQNQLNESHEFLSIPKSKMSKNYNSTVENKDKLYESIYNGRNDEGVFALSSGSNSADLLYGKKKSRSSASHSSSSQDTGRLN
ncbi:hypothetical protein BB561_001653 [Smittium simulii]|uniref:P/Homo B domain-containing protein n=1 Tax=Smittium simulii TaxID=133385 RepID=A0A2T9YTN5_9FUNG|nr:hypothetical protein BB561_001653 [Smittium simulii]